MPACVERRASLIVLGLGVVLFVAGLAAVADARRDWPAPEARADGLELRLVRATWVDHAEDAGGRAGVKVHGLLAGMPEEDHARLTATLVLRNPAATPRRFAWQDLVLRSPEAEAFAASPDSRPVLTVPAGHTLVIQAWFDVAVSDDLFTLWWERGETRARLLATRTPVHFRPTSVAPPAWPGLASELPEGRPDAGARLYHGRLACVACHGRPDEPGSNGPAPHLGAMGWEAARRQPGGSAAQYLYESLLDPGAFMAPACAHLQACASGAPMPAYGEVLSVQDAADLIAYLLAQRNLPSP